MPQTRTYSDLLTAIQAIAGESLTPNEKTRVKQLVNMRARLAYNQCAYWPTFLRVNEPRRVRRSPFDYSQSDINPDDLKSTTHSYDYDPRAWAAKDPPQSSTAGGAGVSNQDYLLLEELRFQKSPGFADIDTIFRVFTGDPFRDKSVHELNFSVNNEKVLLLGKGNTYATDLRIHAYATTIITAGGAIQVTFGNDDYHGFRQWDYYYIDQDELTETTSTGIALNGPYPVTSVTGTKTIITSAAESGLTETSAWSVNSACIKVPTVYCTFKEQLPSNYGDGSGETSAIPREFFNYLVRGVYADFLRSEGQNQKAAAEDANAQSELDIELERVERTQNHPLLLTRYQSHGAEQNRIY